MATNYKSPKMPARDKVTLDSIFTTVSSTSAIWNEGGEINIDYLNTFFVSVTGDTMTGSLSSPSLKSNELQIYNETGSVTDFIKSDGLKMVRYRDEYVGSEWTLGTAGCAPTLSTITLAGSADTELLFRTYTFNSKNNAFHTLYNSFEVPHDIALTDINDPTSGVTMEMHVHWLPLGENNVSGNVVWEFQYVVINRNESPSEVYTARATVAVLENQRQNHMISPASIFPVPDPAPILSSLATPIDGWKMGSVIHFAVRRLGTDAGDTYAASVALIKAAMHIPVDDRGSRQRYTK